MLEDQGGAAMGGAAGLGYLEDSGLHTRSSQRKTGTKNENENANVQKHVRNERPLWRLSRRGVGTAKLSELDIELLSISSKIPTLAHVAILKDKLLGLLISHERLGERVGALA